MKNHALPGGKKYETGVTVANSVEQTHNISVYQTIQFTKNYSIDGFFMINNHQPSFVKLVVKSQQIK